MDLAKDSPIPLQMSSASHWEDDHVLVENLIAKDNGAWTYVFGDLLLPSIRRNRKWSEILHRHAIPQEAVATDVYLYLMANGAANLRGFRFDCSFTTHLFNATRAAMTTIVRALGKEIPSDMSDFEWVVAQKGQTRISPDRALMRREALESANGHLAELWDANPVHTVVLLLRECEGLRAKEVSSILGLTPANVDQIHKRAKTKIAALAGKRERHEN